MIDLESQTHQWVRLHSFSDEWVVILGIGGGQHIERYLQVNPGTRLTVLEFDPQKKQIAQIMQEQYAEQIEIHFFDKDKTNSLPIFHKIFEVLPPVLCFQPGYGAYRNEFETMFRFLTGRSREGLEYFLNLMGSHLTIEQLPQSERLLTIKDLGFVIDIEKVDHPAASVVRILRELIV